MKHSWWVEWCYGAGSGVATLHNLSEPAARDLFGGLLDSLPAVPGAFARLLDDGRLVDRWAYEDGPSLQLGELRRDDSGPCSLCGGSRFVSNPAWHDAWLEISRTLLFDRPGSVDCDRDPELEAAQRRCEQQHGPALKPCSCTMVRTDFTRRLKGAA